MIKWIVTSCVLIAVVALMRRVLRGRMSLRLQYALWALVLVRLLVPLTFGRSDFSVAALLDWVPYTAQEQVASDIVVSIPPSKFQYQIGGNSPDLAMPDLPGVDTSSPEYQLEIEKYRQELEESWQKYREENTRHLHISTAHVLYVLWGFGMAVMAVWLLTVNLKFGAKLRRTRRPLAVEGCSLPVWLTGAVETPCLFGILRPGIYVTPEAAADPETLRHVLAHESTHFRHGDHIWSVLRCLCLVLHWYNPLVWLAASLSRRDCELACDEGAIRAIGEGERAAYGRTLIGLTCAGRGGLIRAATTMTGSKKSIKERILLIAKKPKMAVYTLICVLLIAAMAVGCTFTGGEGNTDPSDDPNATITDTQKPEEQDNGVVRIEQLEGLDGTDFQEVFHIEDGKVYMFPMGMSWHFIVHYEDGSTETIKEALYAGRITGADLERYGVEGYSVVDATDDEYALYYQELGHIVKKANLTFEGIPGYVECRLIQFYDGHMRLDVINYTDRTLDYGTGRGVYLYSREGEKLTRLNLEPKDGKTYSFPDILYEVKPGGERLSLEIPFTEGLELANGDYLLVYPNDSGTGISLDFIIGIWGYAPNLFGIPQEVVDAAGQFLAEEPHYRLTGIKQHSTGVVDLVGNGAEVYEAEYAYGESYTSRYFVLAYSADGNRGVVYNLTFEELNGTYNTPEMVERYGNMYTAAASAAAHSFLDTPGSMSETELDEFRALLSSDHWYVAAMGSIYSDVKEMDLDLVFYGGLPGVNDSWEDFTAAEEAYLIEQGFIRELDVHKMPKEQLSEILWEYFGISVDAFRTFKDWVYYEATDSYYSNASDAYLVHGFTVVAGDDALNGLVRLYYTVEPYHGVIDPATGEWVTRAVLTLQKWGDRYLVVSNEIWE